MLPDQLGILFPANVQYCVFRSTNRRAAVRGAYPQRDGGAGPRRQPAVRRRTPRHLQGKPHTSMDSQRWTRY